MTTRVRALASKMVAEISPGQALTKILFTLGGADANENSIKLARGYTGRHKILARYRSYHGATAGAMAATGDPRRSAWEPNLMTGVVHFLDPYRYRSTFHRSNPEISEEEFAQDYLNHLEEIILYEEPQTIAAILMESVTGKNGILIPTQGYMQGVRALCDKYGILMIADEVMSGFGRTGKWFAIQHWDVVPDLITMAKGPDLRILAAGCGGDEAGDRRGIQRYPVRKRLDVYIASCVAGSRRREYQCDEGRKMIEHASAMGPVLKRMLTDLGEGHPSVGEVRNIGFFGILELVKNRQTKEPMAPWNGSSPEMNALKKYCVDHGLFLYTHWHTVLIIPPLIITEEQLKDGFAVLDKALDLTDKAVKLKKEFEVDQKKLE